VESLRSVFFKSNNDRIPYFDIRYSLFQSFFIDLTGRFFCRRRISQASDRERPVKSRKKLCCFVMVVLGLWERFLTAISRVIVAGGHSHQPITST
jgi:hypothetical protein